MGERVFVTGANGRIGLPLVRALAQEGHEVVGLVRSEDKATSVRQAGAASCLVGTLQDAQVLRRGCQGAARIYHLAGGLRGPGRESADVLNHQGMARLLEASWACGEGPKPLLFTSSCAVYGDRSGLWVDGTYPPSPNTLYGKSKVDAENLLSAAARDGRVTPVVLRLAMVYGPGFPVLMEKAIRKGLALLPGEGLNRIPLLHVDDAVSAILWCARRASPGATIAVAGRDQPTLGEFYQEVARRVGGRPPRFWSTYIPSWIQVATTKTLERGLTPLPVVPPVTPDLLRLMTASVRIRPEPLSQDLGFSWKHPQIQSGLDATFATSAP